MKRDVVCNEARIENRHLKQSRKERRARNDLSQNIGTPEAAAKPAHSSDGLGTESQYQQQ